MSPKIGPQPIIRYFMKTPGLKYSTVDDRAAVAELVTHLSSHGIRSSVNSYIEVNDAEVREVAEIAIQVDDEHQQARAEALLKKRHGISCK